MSSVVTTSENGLKMKIQRKSQRQMSDIENNTMPLSMIPPKHKNNIDSNLGTPKEEVVDNKVKKSVSDTNKIQNSKIMNVSKTKCKNKKQTKLAKEKKLKKKLDKIVSSKNFQEKQSNPEDETIPFSSSSPTQSSSPAGKNNNTSNKLEKNPCNGTNFTISSSSDSNMKYFLNSKTSVKNSNNKTDKKLDYNNDFLQIPHQQSNYSNKTYNNKLIYTSKNNINDHANKNTDIEASNYTDNHTNNQKNTINKESSTQLNLLQKRCEKLVCTKSQKSNRLPEELSPRSNSPSSYTPPTFHPSSHPSTLASSNSSLLNQFKNSNVTTAISSEFSTNQTSSISVLSNSSFYTSTTYSTHSSSINQSIHTSSNQHSIHPNIATPPSTPPSQVSSISPLGLPIISRKCHDVQTDTHDMAVSTDPDCLGPCEPGTSVVLEGIVWNESDNGILVVNVTWRGKTYVGTLMDSTRHDWAPPRFIEEDLPLPATQNYHHYYNWTSCSSSSSSSSNGYFQKAKGDDTSGQMSGEMRKLRKCRKDAAAILSQQQQSTNTNEKPNLTINKTFKRYSSEKEQFQNKAGFFECPSHNCLKRFRHIAGLRYHQSHAHSQNKRGRPQSSMSLADHKKNYSKNSPINSYIKKTRLLKEKEMTDKNMFFYEQNVLESDFNASTSNGQAVDSIVNYKANINTTHVASIVNPTMNSSLDVSNSLTNVPSEKNKSKNIFTNKNLNDLETKIKCDKTEKIAKNSLNKSNETLVSTESDLLEGSQFCVSKKKENEITNDNETSRKIPEFNSSTSISQLTSSIFSPSTSTSMSKREFIHTNNEIDKRNNNDLKEKEDSFLVKKNKDFYNKDFGKNVDKKDKKQLFQINNEAETNEITLSKNLKLEKKLSMVDETNINKKNMNDNKEALPDINKKVSTFDCDTNFNKIVSTEDTTTIISTTTKTSIITSNTISITNDLSSNQLKNNIHFSKEKCSSMNQSVHSSTSTTTTLESTSTNVITTITNKTIIKSVDKQESTENSIVHDNYLKTNYTRLNHHKASSRCDDDLEKGKIYKSSNELKSNVKSKTFDSFFENKNLNKKSIDTKMRHSENSVSKETDGKLEASKELSSSFSNKEKEEKVKEKVKENNSVKRSVHGNKNISVPNNSRKHQYPSMEQTNSNKKSKLDPLSPSVSDAEAFYKSFYSIFGNPPLPLDFLMDPFYKLAMMSDPLIFHKNLIEAQTQMAKSLTSGGMGFSSSGLPFSLMNPLYPNDQISNKTEESKPVDMSSKKSTSQTSPKVDPFSNRFWPSYLLPPSSSSHFFGPLKDSGSDVTSRPLYDLFNDPNIFNAQKEFMRQISPSYNQPNPSFSSQPISNSSSSKTTNKLQNSNNDESQRLYSNFNQNNFNSDRNKKYDGYMNNNNTNTFTYASQTNKGRVKEDNSKKICSPKLSSSPNKKQDCFKNPISLPSLLSQTFDQTSQSYNFMSSSKPHFQSNYNALAPPSPSSNFYYHHSQAPSSSPQYRKLISPFKSKNNFSDSASKQNSKLNNFHQKSNYYCGYNQYLNTNNSINKKSITSSQSSAFNSSNSVSSTSHPASFPITKQTNSYHLPQIPGSSLFSYNEYPAQSTPTDLHPSTAVPEVYAKK